MQYLTLVLNFSTFFGVLGLDDVHLYKQRKHAKYLYWPEMSNDLCEN